jgi:hypothetical protein
MKKNSLLKTDKETTAGRPVYKMNGELISEKSVTIKIGDKYYNAPSLQNGKLLEEDQIRKLIEDGKIKATSVHSDLQSAIKAAKERSKSLLKGK